MHICAHTQRTQTTNLTADKMYHFIFWSLIGCCLLIGGDAGEEVWRALRIAEGSQDDPDGVQAVPHEQEL